MTLVPGADGFVEPAYSDRSLGDVLPAVASALGVDAGLPRTALELPPAPAYVVLLVDGLGEELLREHPHEAPYLHSLRSESITVGVPSTTATSLTSLGTALTPGQHGVVGYTTRIPGTLDLLNALSWPAGVPAADWQPHRTAFARLAAVGVATTTVNQRSFEGSGLTLAGSDGARFVGADKVGERLAAVVAAACARPSVTYTYDGDLDWTGHRFGVGSPQWAQQLVMIDAEVERLRESLPQEVGLVVVADHGMVDSPSSSRVDVDAVPGMTDGVLLLGGEARLRHVYVRSGAEDDVRATWTERLAGLADVLSREEAVARGWFGEVEPRVMPRLGDLVVAARGDAAVLSSAAFPHEPRLVGLHGSLTAAEMLVPLLLG